MYAKNGDVVACFRTVDGYSLFLVNGRWADSADPETVDMTFDNDESGWPSGTDGPLEGLLFSRHDGKIVVLNGWDRPVEQVVNDEAGRRSLRMRYGINVAVLS